MDLAIQMRHTYDSYREAGLLRYALPSFDDALNAVFQEELSSEQSKENMLIFGKICDIAESLIVEKMQRNKDIAENETYEDGYYYLDPEFAASFQLPDYPVLSKDYLDFSSRVRNLQNDAMAVR